MKEKISYRGRGLVVGLTSWRLGLCGVLAALALLVGPARQSHAATFVTLYGSALASGAGSAGTLNEILSIP